jgi:hypothetical protein
MKYLSNALSLGMLPPECMVTVVPGCANLLGYDCEGIATPRLDAISVVGHAGASAIYSQLLGVDVPVNRVSIKLQPGDGTGTVTASFSGTTTPA